MPVSSGIVGLDETIQRLLLGDNVVWQVDDLEDYRFFAEPFIEQAIRDGRECVYLRFAPHPEILKPRPGLSLVEVDPGAGFDYFSREVNHIIEKRGREVFYVLDNISALVVEWATDELLANFFQVTCPYLYEMDTVTYFALTRGKHSNSAVARIRDTTQVLMEVYRVEGRMYVQPLKVGGRYSPKMFLPHVVTDSGWSTVFQSGEAAAVLVRASRDPLRGTAASIAPWDSVYNRLAILREMGREIDEADSEVGALKDELCHMIFGSHPEFSNLAKYHFTVDDLFRVRERVVGSGRIGGKAAGMLLARRMLINDGKEIDFSQLLENHDSFYIGSDVFFTFLIENDLFRLRLQLTGNSGMSHEEFEEVEARFLTGEFNPTIMEQLRNMLDYFGQAPIIARSSSLLEDSFGNAFAGKYRSEFCANQGSPEERLEAFLRAVKLVYASALNPAALAYRRKRGLGESDEQMAILVQRVSGLPYKKYFFPYLAGVAFSHNLYAWSSRIDPRQGIIRLVFGLGTRAVERVGKDYPRMIAVSNPELRPEAGSEIAKYSQLRVDLLDLEANQFASKPVREVLAERDYPHLNLLVSVMSDGFLQDPIGERVGGSAHDYVLTFDNLVTKTDFVKVMGAMLRELESGYGHPVDIEFTASIGRDREVRINLLQCRPLFLPSSLGLVSSYEVDPAARIIFQCNQMINGGVINDIRFIVYIDPETYNRIPGREIKGSLGRLVGRINEHPLVKEGNVMMMGPGRWGSSNINLGVNVSYSDIDNASVLVEIAHEEAGHVPEVSYGTHFFQDLVEAQVIYMPLYPNDPNFLFNLGFFRDSRNALLDLLPEAGDFEEYIRVIDVPAVASGAFAHMVADPQSQRAICFLK